MSIQLCTVDKSRITRLIEHLLESVAFISLVVENISPKFEIRSRADVWRLNVSNVHAGRYRREYDRNGAYLWDAFPHRRVVIVSKQMNGPDANRSRHRATESSIFHTCSITTSLLLGAGRKSAYYSARCGKKNAFEFARGRGVVLSHDDA